MSDSQKQKAPAPDQAQALAVQIPGALPPPEPVVVDLPPPPPVPVVGDPPAATPAPVGVDVADVRPAPPAAPMLVDVPIDLSHNVPGAEPSVDRPASDAHKDEWATWAISRGVPSYEAWALTIPELKKMEA